MSLALVHTRALDGMDAPPVVVEVHLANGLPAFNLVGLPDTEVREARERVRAALQTGNFEFPQRRITVNLAPADLPKEGGRFDLPIAVGILAASGQLNAATLASHEFAGELSLSGELRPIRGALAMALQTRAAGRTLILPTASAQEAARVRDVSVRPADSLLAVCAHLNGQTPLPDAPPPSDSAPLPAPPDLADVKGQLEARRALEVAAAGSHSLLMYGPPGTGKSMLAQRLAGILPPLDEAAALEAAAVQSLGGHFDPATWGRRAFRAPHHSASAPAIVGGGAIPGPGEISMAHHGVLFLDELPEFDRRVLEALREPLESGHVEVARARRRARFPARFQLVAAMNPCPCGYLGDARGRCRCTPDQVARYRGKLSGPLLDRIDLTLEVGALNAAELERAEPGEDSATVLARVLAARQRQQARQGGNNAALDAAGVVRHCRPDDRGRQVLARAVESLGLSARSHDRILRVARTIADLAGAEGVAAPHVAEAIQYRRGLGASAR
ncbi:MAG: YifB family Mg chelatase-like AAA ATPase [Denitromonas halophila]|nr:MAG: YifB family Mg chelatase-like AAA ATPase [Denitromonas halophila]TVT71262.1 MAG: YifB family Mg chelatase-like AAA ATPase [Denitromonas halophila]TVT72259.1 MAG: YifB family Mg chelatase-like AAA ATPase [Denitromonas halophila]